MPLPRKPAEPPPSAPPAPAWLVGMFLLVLVTPGLGLLMGFGANTISESEMRELAQAPVWSWKADEMVRWPAAFKLYFEDRFAMRTWLIDLRARTLLRWFGTSPSDAVLAGRDGWLFYADDGALNDWTQQAPFPPSELEDWRRTLERRHAFLARRGIPYLFVIAPDKHMIYPEQMPTTVRRLRQDYRADQLVAYLRTHAPHVRVLDLRNALLEAKGTEVLYHRSDTHWNDRGALVAYRAILAAIAPWFPTLTPLTRDDFDTSSDVPSGDKTSLLGLADSGKRTMPGLVLRRGRGYRIVEPRYPNPYGEDGVLITAHPDATLPKAFIFRDSFAARLIPYLSEHFSRTLYYWQNELDYEAIEQERPDIVIQEFVARHFYTYGPYPRLIPE